EVTLQARAWQSDRRAPRRWPAAAYSRLQVGRLRQFEATVARGASAVTCVSEADAAALRALVPGLDPVIVPNGIELADYPLPQADLPAATMLAFSGKMDYRPNVDAVVWFAIDIWPRIREHRPQARCVVVGMNPTPQLRRAGAAPGLEVLGAVPDTRPYI